MLHPEAPKTHFSHPKEISDAITEICAAVDDSAIRIGFYGVTLLSGDESVIADFSPETISTAAKLREDLEKNTMIKSTASSPSSATAGSMEPSSI